MNFEDLKVIWDEETLRPSATIDEEALHRMVRGRAEAFEKKDRWRDAKEIGASIVLVIFFLAEGIWSALREGGPDILMIVACFVLILGISFVCRFMLVNRRRQKAREAHFEETIQGNLKKLISNITCKIKLQRNVAWWYLFPFVPGVILHLAATSFSDPWVFGLMTLFVFLLYAFVFWLNRRVADKDLIPQKRKLETLLARLEQNSESTEL